MIGAGVQPSSQLQWQLFQIEVASVVDLEVAGRSGSFGRGSDTETWPPSVVAEALVDVAGET